MFCEFYDIFMMRKIHSKTVRNFKSHLNYLADNLEVYYDNIPQRKVAKALIIDFLYDITRLQFDVDINNSLRV